MAQLGHCFLVPPFNLWGRFFCGNSWWNGWVKTVWASSFTLHVTVHFDSSTKDSSNTLWDCAMSLLCKRGWLSMNKELFSFLAFLYFLFVLLFILSSIFHLILSQLMGLFRVEWNKQLVLYYWVWHTKTNSNQANEQTMHPPTWFSTALNNLAQ